MGTHCGFRPFGNTRFNESSVVNHGTDSNVARPSFNSIVIWRGTAIPANPNNGDRWNETRRFYSPDKGLWTYDSTIGLWVKGTDTVSVDWVSDHTVAASGSVELNFGASTGNRTINWGDGTIAVVNTARPAHTYTDAGTYQVRASGGTTGRLGDRTFAPVAAWTGTLQRVRSWGNLGFTSFQSGFQTVSGNFGVPRYVPSSVPNLFGMFNAATAFNQDIGAWDVSNVTNMAFMLQSAAAFNQDISGWDVSKVTTMQNMFAGAAAFDQDIGGWDVSNVTNMNSLFFACAVFDQDIGGWDTSKVTNMTSMFANASAFNQDIGGWDVKAVTTMNGMFRRAVAGTNVFNQDLGAWQLRLAGVDMTNMFADIAGSLSLSTENYSRTLIGWANYVDANSDTPANVTLGAGNRTYNTTAYVSGQTYNDAAAARAYLVGSPPDWTITDGGQV